VLQGEKYREVSERNRVREVPITPPRGLLIDRHGEVLVDNRPAYAVFAIPYEVRSSDGVLHVLSKGLGMDEGVLRERIRQVGAAYFTPVKLKRQIDFETLSFIEENKLDLPGVLYQIEPRRYYPAGVKAPHLFGYLGEVTDDELAVLKRTDEDYRAGDLIGKKGLERQYEAVLKGHRGYSYVEVDALGREVRPLPYSGSREAVPGVALHLALDAKLQRHLESLMEGKKGGAVVIDTRTGGVLALVSKPDYDPELFTKPLTPEIWSQLASNPDHPLYDRMVQSVFPAGSTFKLVLAAAALEKANLSLNWHVHCPGYFRFGNRTFECWKKQGHGRVSFFEAVEQSCNVYFYNLGLQVGLETWAEFAKAFGFGKPTGIDLPGESPGQVPDEAYLSARYGKGRWPRGLILNVSVGQGDLLVTPLQMAMLAAIIANDGLRIRPHLVEYMQDPAKGSISRLPVDSSRIPGVSKQTFQIIKQGMYLVVNGPKGTGRAAWVMEVPAAGKTGTAQNPHGDDHAWFIGFAPFDRPQIAFCVFVENGGKGGGVAAPIAGEIIRKYFGIESTPAPRVVKAPKPNPWRQLPQARIDVH